MTQVTREPVTREAVDHILAHLREHDRHEILAQRWDDDLDALAAFVMALACNDLWRVFRADGEPVALIGATLIRPGVCTLCGFGSHRWGQVIRPLTRYVLDEMMPAVLRSGVHRAEAYVMAENTRNLRWITSLGGEIEGVLRGYGRGGEDFVVLGWRRDHVYAQWGRRFQRTSQEQLHEQFRRHGADAEQGIPQQYIDRGATTVAQYQLMAQQDASDQQLTQQKQIADQQNDAEPATTGGAERAAGRAPGAG